MSHPMTEEPSEPYQHLRQPPHSLVAEETLVGALLQWNECIDACSALEPEHFHSARLRAIYAEARAQITACRPADAVTVYEGLTRGESRPELAAYIGQCIASVFTARGVPQLVERIIELATDRGLIAAADRMAAAAFRNDPGSSAQQRIGDAMAELQRLASGAAGRREPLFVDESLADYIDAVQIRGTPADVYFPTGLADLDRRLSGGLRPGQVAVVGARPSMGKTTLAMTIARHVAGDRHGYAALVLSQEMPRHQLMDASVAALGHIALGKVRMPDPNDGDTWTRITEGAHRLSQLRLLIDDQPGLTLGDVRTKTLTAQRKAGGKLGLVVIDFLQLMEGPGDNRNAQLDPIVNGIKKLSLELGVAVLVLSQCNRSADAKPGGADSMSDLRDSGAIEAAADIVGLLHREFVRSKREEQAHYGELRMVKNRFGETGDVRLYFEGAHQFFGAWTGPAPIIDAVSGGGARRTHSGEE